MSKAKYHCDMCEKKLTYREPDEFGVLLCGTCRSVVTNQRKRFEDPPIDILDEVNDAVEEA